MFKVALPKFDANTLEATLGPWHKSVGERVEKGDILVDVITDKANFELQSEAAGTLRQVLAPEKSEVPLGYIVALLGEPDELLVDVSEENRRMMAEYLAGVGVASRSQSGPSGVRKPDSTAPSADRVRATPRARRLAKERGIDLTALAKRLGVDVVTEEHVAKFEIRNPKPE